MVALRILNSARSCDAVNNFVINAFIHHYKAIISESDTLNLVIIGLANVRFS